MSLGDKEASFTGSSNWIGAIELSYILDEYLGITSKVGARLTALQACSSRTSPCMYAMDTVSLVVSCWLGRLNYPSQPLTCSMSVGHCGCVTISPTAFMQRLHRGFSCCMLPIAAAGAHCEPR